MPHNLPFVSFGRWVHSSAAWAITRLCRLGDPVTVMRVGQGDDVASGVITRAIAGDVAIGNWEAGWNFEEHVL